MVVDQIQNIVNSLDVSLEVTAVSELSETNEQTITFKNLRWIKLFKKLDGKTIKSITNKSVTLSGVSVAYTMLSVFTLQLPTVLNGTLSNTKSEWDKFKGKESEKLPFIWLKSPTQTTSNPTELITANCELWFVHWSDWSKLNVDRQNESLRPLQALFNEFLETIRRKRVPNIKGFTNYSANDYPKFGEMEKNGVSSLLFNSTLSAIELNISLQYLDKCCNFE